MNWFLAAEAGIIAAFLLTCFHAYRSRQLSLLAFLAVNSWLVEQIAYSMYHAVSYGNFNLWLLDVPVAVVLGWSVLLYSVLLFVGRRNQLALAPLIMLLVDAALEPAAVSLGFWTWSSSQGIYGMPLNNYFAWWLFSILIVYFASYPRLKGTLLVHAIGIPVGLLWFVLPTPVQYAVLAAILALSLLSVRKEKRIAVFGVPILIFPLFFIVASPNSLALFPMLLLLFVFVQSVRLYKHVKR